MKEFVGLCNNVKEFVGNLEIVRVFKNFKNVHQFIKNLQGYVKICEFTRTNILFNNLKENSKSL